MSELISRMRGRTALEATAVIVGLINAIDGLEPIVMAYQRLSRGLATPADAVIMDKADRIKLVAWMEDRRTGKRNVC